VVTWFRVALAAILGSLSLSTPSGASTPLPTLTVAIPGQFTGCDALHPLLSPSDQALLDLTRPSAFLTSVQGNLRGEGGAIVSAELSSLDPQIVTYTLDTSLHWTNGRHFGASDLITWWHEAVRSRTVAAVGYRDITSLSPSANGAVVSATFRTPFAAWPLLFRDIEQGLPPGANCSLHALLAQPSLGPYRLVSLTATRAVLRSNPVWTASYNRLPAITLTTSTALPPAHALFASYYPELSTSLVASVSQRPSLASHIGATDVIEELQYAMHRPLTRSAALRRAWSHVIDKAALLRSLYGAITFTPLVATSRLFAQNEFGAPVQGETTHASAPCLPCAVGMLQHAGLERLRGRWRLQGRNAGITVARGPSAADRQTSAVVAAQWRRFGLDVRIVRAGSEAAASAMAAEGRVDVAVISRPVGANPWVASTGALGIWSPESFSLGSSLPAVQQAVQVALADFNPVTASAKWQIVDDALAASGAIEPLFTPPSLTAWSTNVTNLAPSLSLLGFIDQVANWGTTHSFERVGNSR